MITLLGSGPLSNRRFARRYEWCDVSEGNILVADDFEPLIANADARFRICVVDDHDPWRQEICTILQTQPGLRVVGEAADGLQAVQKAQELKPDLILLDIGLPNLNGIEAANRIRQVAPDTRIIFLTQNNNKDVVRAALGTGAQGYVLKTDAGSELLNAVAGVWGGDHFVSSGIAGLEPGETENA